MDIMAFGKVVLSREVRKKYGQKRKGIDNDIAHCVHMQLHRHALLDPRLYPNMYMTISN